MGDTYAGGLEATSREEKNGELYFVIGRGKE